MAAHLSPIQCIVPPHILKEVVRNGAPSQRAWAMRTLTMSEQMRGRRQVLGAMAIPDAVGGKHRSIYDAKHVMDLPGVPVRDEGDPESADVTVNEAYDGAGATYDLYADVYDRTSIDDKGLRLVSTVHYAVDYDNAFWDGQQMVYGDGDGQIFQRFTKSIDVIGHELTHGVTQYEAGLVYWDQPGALNESFSDVFGSLVKQRSLGQTVDKADWLIGEGLLTPAVHGVALRSMMAPGTAYDDPVIGKDPQPAHMRDFVTTNDDNGGVHINSGIPNHAFYLTAMSLGGNAWEDAGRIWYVALRDRIRSRSTFQQAADLIVRVATELYGAGSRQDKAVRNGWAQVGITVR
jgi:Zn-dependent metalloprotease